jgi:prepilin-type N-terminal cleavage/methylation domain-containing protein
MPHPTVPSAARASRGFSFVEVLIVMGILSVLAGLGVLAVNLLASKGPKIQTTTLLSKVRGSIDHWNSRFHAYPPSDATRLATVTGATGLAVGKLGNNVNAGNESLYLAFLVPGFGRSADLGDEELSNTDDDRTDKPFVSTATSNDLWEIKDAWGNPLVYIAAADYVAFDKDPPVYYTGADGEGVEPEFRPRPWKSEKTGAFAQPRSYQLFSIGPDSLPNTDDDVKAWE